MKKHFNHKPAVTMAELIIVIVIVAIIAGIFLALPRKNVSKMDRAKYYIASDMLKRLQDEQIAQKGCADIDQNSGKCTAGFAAAVNDWLNVVTTNADGNAVRLTNGMILGYANAYDNTNSRRIVTVDVDGDGGTDNNFDACTADADHPNCVQFFLYSEYTNDYNAVVPDTNINTATQLPFRVFIINDDGNMVIKAAGVTYTAAHNKLTNKDVSNDCNNDCFMEAIPPL